MFQIKQCARRILLHKQNHSFMTLETKNYKDHHHQHNPHHLLSTDIHQATESLDWK